MRINYVYRFVHFNRIAWLFEISNASFSYSEWFRQNSRFDAVVLVMLIRIYSHRHFMEDMRGRRFWLRIMASSTLTFHHFSLTSIFWISCRTYLKVISFFASKNETHISNERYLGQLSNNSRWQYNARNMKSNDAKVYRVSHGVLASRPLTRMKQN
jgi:hypothetical protein